jgi:16S rRNA (guanine527-N7)-methyltransferase
VSDALLERWLAAVLETPGLTGLRELEQGRLQLLEDALRGTDVVRWFEGTIVDVGSGGGTPGIPLAVALPEREVTLLEAQRRKADFLRRWEGELPNLRIVWGRAEEQPPDAFGVAVAKALASPPVAAEWCLPLVRPGGGVVLWVGHAADRTRVARVAARVAGEPVDAPDGFLVLRKIGPTPPGFPRPPGMAKKRPLA